MKIASLTTEAEKYFGTATPATDVLLPIHVEEEAVSMRLMFKIPVLPIHNALSVKEKASASLQSTFFTTVDKSMVKDTTHRTLKHAVNRRSLGVECKLVLVKQREKHLFW